MSELKVYSQCYDGTDGLFYLKSEADKVIEDLEESHKMEVEQFLIEIAELKDKLRHYPIMVAMIESDNLEITRDKYKIRHQKYKRCLAMAWWCSAELGMLVSTWESKIKHYKRWHQRWLALADKYKYKEAK